MAAAAALALTLTACGSSGGAGESTTAAAGSGTQNAAGGGTQTLKIVLRSQLTSPPLYYGLAKGLFKEAGLDLDITVSATGTPATLVAKQADLAGISLSAILGVVNEGADAKVVYPIDGGAQGYVVAAANSPITSPAQCKTMVTGIPGTNNYGWTIIEQKLFGVTWKLSQITDVPSFSNMVISGQSDCAIAGYSVFDTGLSGGKLKLILDPAQKAALPKGWPAGNMENVFAGLSSVLDAKSAAISKFLKAYQQSVDAFRKADPKEIATTLLQYKDFAGSTQASLEASATHLKDFLSPGDGHITQDSWKLSVDFFANSGTNYLDGSDTWSFDKRVDTALLNGTSGG